MIEGLTGSVKKVEVSIKKKQKVQLSDLDECKVRILLLLDEYNCKIQSCDGWSAVLLEDVDTKETKLISR